MPARTAKSVGRIAAIIDRNHINIHNEQAGFFGFFECLPDHAIAQGLLDAASAWLKERDIEIMRGPMNPSTNDECGFLLEGFDSPPMIMMTYTPPYYLDYMERCGLTKAKDLFAYISVIRRRLRRPQARKAGISRQSAGPRAHRASGQHEAVQRKNWKR